MNKTICGTCSICGGTVSVPMVYWSVVPPVPKCERCGAVAAPSGPVIPMVPAPGVVTITTSSGTVRIVENESTPQGFMIDGAAWGSR